MHPAPPPDRDELLSTIEKGRLATILMSTIRIASPSDSYLPWDKLRYQKPPRDLTPQEWWLGVKMMRINMLRPLPLQMIGGREFAYALPDEVLQLTDEITRRTSGQIAAPEPVTNPATRNRYVISSLIEESITSSQLEGASTSRIVAKEMIRSGRQPRDRSERMILNNYNAMLFVAEHRDEDFTPALVCELHRIVTAGTLDDPESAGRIQSNPDPDDRVKVFGREDDVLHIPPPVAQLPARLQALCAFANATSTGTAYVPAVVRALIVHFMVGYDHYFEDGNGRTARALFYWSMLKQGYWLTEYLTISRILKKAPAQYVRSFVLTEQDEGDLTYFLIYHLKVIKQALDELNQYLVRKSAELQEARRLLSSRGEFNHRQLALIESSIKNPGNHYTVQTHMVSHGVSDQTARNDLNDLEKRGLLVRSKMGRNYTWSPAPNFEKVLADR
ncbi:Fic family protein [Nocardia arthritidis]|uniref:DeoR family transcriptional regulator n=1 Tax=Nocardia arthritidis TaxID=228602 RepID=A0A6G9YN24_9NOCA|nr:Fic family protein [Nocardia arthritidis]QIS14602.1 DeoR family transcriptional regulator [Nocardia arthritidis]